MLVNFCKQGRLKADLHMCGAICKKMEQAEMKSVMCDHTVDTGHLSFIGCFIRHISISATAKEGFDHSLRYSIPHYLYFSFLIITEIYFEHSLEKAPRETSQRE